MQGKGGPFVAGTPVAACLQPSPSLFVPERHQQGRCAVLAGGKDSRAPGPCESMWKDDCRLSVCGCVHVRVREVTWILEVVLVCTLLPITCWCTACLHTSPSFCRGIQTSPEMTRWDRETCSPPIACQLCYSNRVPSSSLSIYIATRTSLLVIGMVANSFGMLAYLDSVDHISSTGSVEKDSGLVNQLMGK